jgi:hypothetical protein
MLKVCQRGLLFFNFFFEIPLDLILDDMIILCVFFVRLAVGWFWNKQHTDARTHAHTHTRTRPPSWHSHINSIDFALFAA